MLWKVRKHPIRAKGVEPLEQSDCCFKIPIKMAWSAPEDSSRWDPEKLLVCPYDEVHLIKAKWFQHHLMECRENHADKDFVSCRFNAKHVMLRSEGRHHVSRCPDRVSAFKCLLKIPCISTYSL